MNIYRFIPNKTSALLFSLICVLTLAACAGGSKPPPAGPSLLNLRIIPDTNNATLIWDNPDMEIASINITYHNRSTPDALQYFPLITDEASISANATVTKMITGLEDGSTYSFRVALEFGGTDVNKSIIAEEIRRQIGPNLDQDEYADADPDELDEDGDGVNDNLDAFPRNDALSGFGVTDLTATPGNSSVTLSWTNPVANISSIRISYHNTNAPNDLQDHPLIEDSPRTNSSATNVEETIDGLVNGQSYNFTVRLILDRDDAGKKVVVASTTATPGAFSVIDLLATPGNGNVTLSWINPDADIASISISYEVTGSGASTTVAASNTIRRASVEQTIDGLDNEVSYTFTVSLILQNDDAGKEGVPPSATATPDVFAVTDLVAAPGAGNVTLSWNNPAADIASISIRYGITGSSEFTTVVTSNTGRGASVEQTITGLMNGVPYNFTISLTLQNDDAGREGPAPSATATPNVFSVTDLTAVPNDSSVTLNWNNPAADIASISISYQQDGSTLQEFPTITDSSKRGMSAMGVQQVIPGLTNEEYYNFTVDLTLEGDDTGREGPALSIIVAIGPNLDGDELPDFMDDDIDGDSFMNADDVDDDGDGLIEIATAEQLNQVREVLSGVSFAGNNTGCGGLNGISVCGGYELVADISLTGYNGDNWEPIGICGNNTCSAGSELFNTVFDGNGYTISDLTITNPGGPYYNAAGLFAAIRTPAELRNINIASARITVNGNNVGVLVGYMDGGNITNSHVLDSTVNGTSNIGGLVGNGANAPITSSSADIVSVSGVGDSVGGLVGSGGSAIIISSNATVRMVSGHNNIGGLIGWGNNAVITSSYSESENVSGNAIIGGLVGLGNNIAITSSYATGVVIDGFQDVGGLVGQGDNANIALSSADTMSTAGSFHVGALIGRGHMATITSSYAVSEDVSTINNRAGGLIGWGNDANILSSYAAVRTISGGGEIGGLVGRGLGTDITSSYAVVRTMSGTGLGGLVGWGNATTSVTASYWDTQSNGVTLTISNRDPDDSSAGKTTTQLQSPTVFAGSIYATWENDICDDGTDTWNLGLNDQYPALNCTPGGADAQRP